MAADVKNKSTDIEMEIQQEENVVTTNTQQAQVDESVIAEHRKRLYNFIIQTTDTRVVDFEKITLLFRHIVNDNPQMFVYPVAYINDENGAHKKPNQALSKAFSKWVINRFLQWLGPPCNPAVGKSCVSCIITLLELIHVKDPIFFKEVFAELIKVATDLVKINESFYDGDDDTIGKLDYIWFKPDEISQDDDEPLKLEAVPVAFEDPLQCEMFAVAITNIITRLSLPASQFASPDSILCLWKVLCFQLECGPIDLKQVTLEASSELLNFSGLPANVFIEDYFTDCLSTLLEDICNGNTKQFDTSKLLENNFAKCLRTYTKEQESNMVERNLTLVEYFERNLETIITHGLTHAQTTDLVTAITELIMFILKTLQDLELLSGQKLLRLCQKIVLECFPGKCDKNVIARCVFQLIKEEMVMWKCSTKRNKSPAKKGENANLSIKRSTYRSILEPQTVAPTCAPELDVAQFSPTWCKMQAIILNTSQNLRDCGEPKSQVEISQPALEELEIAAIVGMLCVVHVKVGDPLSDSSFLEERNQWNQLYGASNWTQVVTWFPNDLPRQLVLVCFKILISKPSRPIYLSVMNILMAMLYAQDECNLSEVWPVLTAIVSLPWLETEKETDKTMFEFVMKLLPVMGKVFQPETSTDRSILKTCLWSLAVLPPDVARHLRLSVFRTILCGQNLGNQKLAVEVIPLLLHQLKTDREPLTNMLMTSQVFSVDLECQITIAGVVGKMACVLADRAVIARDKIESCLDFEFVNLLESRCITCCSGADLDLTDSEMESTQPLALDPIVAQPFFKLINHPSKQVKQTLIQSLKFVFNHTPLHPTLISSTLNLVEDESEDIRILFSNVFPEYIKRGSRVTQELEIIIGDRLKEAITRAKRQKDIRLHETILLTLGQLGRVAQGDLLLGVIVCLLQNLFHSSVNITSTAQIQLKEIGTAKKMSMNAIFLQFKKRICELLVNLLHRENEKDGQDVLAQFVNVFTYTDVKTFLTIATRYLVPQIVCKATPKASSLLRLLAKHHQNLNRRELIVHNIKFIFAYIVCNCTPTSMEQALTFLEKETEIKIGYLLRIDYQGMYNELLLHIGSHYDQVFSGLTTLALRDDDYEGPKDITREAMADFLKPKLLGFLFFFDVQFLIASVPLEEKKLALQSLIEIMNLMGPMHITPVRMKIMATLRIVHRFHDVNFQELCCTAWSTFIHNVELSALGMMLSQIVVTLLPLLKQKPKEISKIFNYLIVEKRESMKDYFHELHLIPEVPELESVNAALKEHNEKPNNREDFKTLLLQSLKAIAHENVDVRIYALSKLKHILTNNKSTIDELILGNETVDPIITQLVNALMLGCRESDSRVRTLIGQCLGELGAIDPGRLERDSGNCGDELAKVHCNVSEENFAFDLIQELVRAFLAAEETRIQDCSSFALQELLRIFKCKDGEDDSEPGVRLWRRFPPHIQEILSPLHQSKYKVSDLTKVTQLCHPVFRSAKGSTFKDWICNWTGFLITKVKQETASKIFNACSMTIKYDISTALYLLPCISLYTILDGSDAERQEVYKELLAVLSWKEMPDPKKIPIIQADLCDMSTQSVFSVLDYLTKWVRKKMIVQNTQLPRKRSSSTSATKSATVDPNSDIKLVKAFLNEIPQDILASASFRCKAYTRALMHVEAHIKTGKTKLQNQLGFLQKLFVALDEPDGIAGVAAVREEEPTLQEQILIHESTGQFQDAFVCYERAIQLEPTELSHYHGLLKSLMNLDQVSTALTYASGFVAQRPEWTQALNQYQIEAAWKLGNWNGLQKFVKSKDSLRNSPGVGIGQLLLAARNKESEKFVRLLEMIRYEIMGPLSAASMENCAYQRGYEYLVRLHMLNEIEKSGKVFFDLKLEKDAKSDDMKPMELLREWDTRIQLAQSSLHFIEPVQSLRRVILGLAKDNNSLLDGALSNHIGCSWLQSAKIARKCGHIQRNYSCLLEASAYNIVEVFLEKAKWHWSKGEHDQAMSSIQNGLQKHYGNLLSLKGGNVQLAQEEKFACAKAKLLLARYSEESGNLESSAIINMFKEVKAIHHDWEDAHFYLAQYYERIYSTMEHKAKRPDLVCSIVKTYGQSLQYGCHYLYQSMPRLLSLWFEMGTQLAALMKNHAANAEIHKQFDNNMKTITYLCDNLPPYYFLATFRQLISRICHSHREVYQQLKQIIAKLLAKFPQQTMWSMMAVSKSSYPMRVKRCQEIFARARELNPSLHKFLQDATMLTDRLLELCNKPVKDNTNTMSIRVHFASIASLVENRNFSSILLPQQSAMTVTLPSSHGGHANHNPFPQNLVYIQGFEDLVEIMQSLQKPKKISMRGSDGKVYIMMCKPKDDLRKDCRLMEFNALVNKSLLRDAEARRRQLHIRTYTVVPLNEECGLIEWVPNVTGLRIILMKLYAERKLGLPHKELKTHMLSTSAPLEEKLRAFKTKLLPHFPPVFSDWFLQTFLDPTTWYNARLAYARTAAVMSMVGYILGIGDRHGENILIDSSCGDVVHVDFNCLFNRGETFEWPERVPFRLTRNMVDALGPTGVEGIYRKSCEVTLRVMRKQMETLMSVLKPFIHDPLVEWSKPLRGGRVPVSDSGEINNEKALVSVRDIELRLKGIIKNKNKAPGLPLSVEGQANYLIHEATSDENLCQMYIGWAPFL